MLSEVTIRASFKQATVKGSAAILQFEVLTEDVGAFDLLRMSGKKVDLTVADLQPQIVFVDADGEVE